MQHKNNNTKNIDWVIKMQVEYAKDKEQVTFEATRILFQNTQKSFIAAVFVAIMMLFSTEHYVSSSSALKWISIILLTYFARTLVAHFFNQDKHQEKNIKNWLYAFRLTSVGCGVAWGLAAYFILPTNNAALQAVLVLAMAGVCAGALINLSLDSIAAMFFAVSLWLTASPIFLTQENNASSTMFILLAAFIIFVGIASKQLARGLKDSIYLRLSAETKESELSHLTQRQSLHLKHTPMGVIEWDESLHVAAWNNACMDIFGYESAEALGKHISFFMPNVHKIHTQQILEMLEQDKVNVIQLHHSNGQVIYCEWHNTVLKNQLGNMVGMASLVQNKTEFINSQEKIYQLAYFDALTNLPNRGLLLDRINQTLAASKRNKTYSMLAFIDLDHFKAINDIKGHDAGDYLLQTVAQRLQKNMRAQDTAARLGGDEFVLVLSDIGKTKKQAEAYTRNIIDKITLAINAPVQFDDYQHNCSASIGVCMFNDDRLDATELLRRADVAMYLSKKQGRNTYQFYDDSLLPEYEYQLKLKHDLNHALANNEFELHLQGQYNRDSRITGAEVLLRWQHAELGMVMPNCFIPLAEETGAIVPIGSWVLAQACALLKKWQADEASSHLTVSVNVSAVQFNHPDFILQVEKAIQQSGCDATKLCIELTESSVISNIEESIAKMHQIKAMGVSLAIDDFGTGYSSLSALKNLPLDELKIDRSFVKDFTKNPIDLTIVQTILQMGKNLNLRIVAEGVENESQMSYLSNYGCSMFQGYFFATPCSINSFEQQFSLNKLDKKTKHAPQTNKKLMAKANVSHLNPVMQTDFMQQDQLENNFNLVIADYITH